MERAALEYLIEHPFENVVATKIIKDALEYRIAKPPIKKRTEKHGFISFCPTCGMDTEGFRYCPNCGQNIEWQFAFICESI